MDTNDLRIEKKDDHLLVTFSGEFSGTSGKKVVDTMIDASSESGEQRVVLDCRGMTGKMGLFEKFEVAVYGRRIVGTIDRLAIINRPEVMEPDNFVKTVANNRGVNLNLFTELDEGVRWVTSETL